MDNSLVTDNYSETKYVTKEKKQEILLRLEIEKEMRKQCIKEGKEYKVEKINIENSNNKKANISYDYQLLNDEQYANIIRNENY